MIETKLEEKEIKTEFQKLFVKSALLVFKMKYKKEPYGFKVRILIRLPKKVMRENWKTLLQGQIFSACNEAVKKLESKEGITRVYWEVSE